MSELLKTKERFCGCRVFIESTGNPEVDEAMQVIFHDHYSRTAPLSMRRRDVSLVNAWMAGDLEPATVPGVPAIERDKGQLPLFGVV